MHKCPNCISDLVKKNLLISVYQNFKYSTRLKCSECGYEVSEWQMKQDKYDFRIRIIEKNRINPHYRLNNNLEWEDNNSIDLTS